MKNQQFIIDQEIDISDIQGEKDVQKNDITTAIPGATSSTYTVTKDDAGYRLQLVVTPVAGVKGMSTDANGKTKTYPLGKVSTSNVAVSIKVDNKDADTTTVGKTLAASVTPATAADDVTYQWYVVSGSDADEIENKISGATGATYTPSVAGKYRVKISLKQGEKTWVISTVAADVTVKNAATKTVAITNAWNVTAHETYNPETGIARSTNQIGDVLKLSVNDGSATVKWYLKGVTDNTTGKDVVLGDGKTLTVPASKHVNDEDVSTVGKSVYAVVTGAADDFVGTTATSKEFAITAAPSKLAKVSVKVGVDVFGDLGPDTTNTVAVASGSVDASDGTQVVITPSIPAELLAKAKVTTNATGAKVEAGVITITGVKTTDDITFTVDFDGDGDAYTPVTYTVDMSKVTRA